MDTEEGWIESYEQWHDKAWIPSASEVTTLRRYTNLFIIIIIIIIIPPVLP